MSRSKPPRKRYRPGAVKPLVHLGVLAASHRLGPADRALLMRAFAEALAEMHAPTSTEESRQAWIAVVDYLGLTRAIAEAGIVCGPEVDAAIGEAGDALAACHARAHAGGAWGVGPDEIEAFEVLRDLHERQVSEVTHAEYGAAVDRVAERGRQALRGNVAPGAQVLVGALAAQSTVAVRAAMAGTAGAGEHA